MKAKKRSPAATDLAITNDILRALLSSEYRHLRPRLQRVDLEAGDVVYAMDQRIDHVYFPETAVVAMIDTLEDGSTVEVGVIGHEGMVGINVFLGSLVTPDHCVGGRGLPQASSTHVRPP